MSELELLLESSESPRTRALLRAARGDAPAHGFSERMLVSLGLGVAAGTVSVAASAGAAGAALQGAVTTSTSTTGLGLLVAKWVAVGVVGGGVLAGGAEVAFAPRDAKPSASVAVVPPAPPQQQLQPRALPAAAPSAEYEPEAEPEPEPAAEPAERAGSAQAAAVASASPGGLGREVEAIDRARSALRSGDFKRALNELNGFERIESTGVLAREAKVLRIETLHRMGQVARARQLSEQYSKQYPNDTHAARLRALEQGEE